MKIIGLIAFLVFITGCSTSLGDIQTKEVYMAQKTEVKIIECDTGTLHQLINTDLESNNPDKLLITISRQWELIGKLYNCIERQQNEIRSKQ